MQPLPHVLRSEGAASEQAEEQLHLLGGEALVEHEDDALEEGRSIVAVVLLPEQLLQVCAPLKQGLLDPAQHLSDTRLGREGQTHRQVL